MTTENTQSKPTDIILKVGTFKAAVRRLVAQPDDLIVASDVLESIQDAEALLSAANAEAAQIREMARQEGVAQALRQTIGLLEQAEALRLQSLRDSQRDVLTLAMATARKLIGHSLQADPQLAVTLAERSMRELRPSQQIVVRVAPELADALESSRDRLTERTGDAALTIQADPSLSPGDCVIDTEMGRIDARLDIQFETIIKALLPPKEP